MGRVERYRGKKREKGDRKLKITRDGTLRSPATATCYHSSLFLVNRCCDSRRYANVVYDSVFLIRDSNQLMDQQAFHPRENGKTGYGGPRPPACLLQRVTLTFGQVVGIRDWTKSIQYGMGSPLVGKMCVRPRHTHYNGKYSSHALFETSPRGPIYQTRTSP